MKQTITIAGSGIIIMAAAMYALVWAMAYDFFPSPYVNWSKRMCAGYDMRYVPDQFDSCVDKQGKKWSLWNLRQLKHSRSFG